MINNQLKFEANKIAIAVKSQFLLFDLKIGGHHASYIKYLVEYWCKYETDNHLFVVVSPNFIRLHSDVVQITKDKCNSNVSFIFIEEDEYTLWSKQNNPYLKTFYEWNIFCKYARDLKIDHALIMYIDHFQLPLALGLKAPCSVSGIYFRPTFHYKNFDNYTFSWKDNLKEWQKSIVISKTLQNKSLKYCFCLDEFAVKHIREKYRQSISQKVHYLPDPVDIYIPDGIIDKVLEKKQELGIETQRKVFTLFGRLDSRKGIHQVLEAIKILPRNITSRICLLLIGEIPQKEQPEVSKKITELSKFSSVQIISNNSFIPEDEVPLHFHLSDIILAPYQRHIGMSGILLLAAAAQTPVLSSDYGLMGQLVETNKLGITVDSTKVKLIADGILRFLNEDKNSLFEPQKAQNFASKHQSNYFCKTITHYLNLE